MKLDPILTKATRLLRRGKYGEAVQILETEVVRYHDSPRYYYILGSACLRLGDFSGAYTYFKKLRDLRMRDPQALLGLAALFLRRGDTDRAVDFYLEVQELSPKNKTAQRALQVIRKHGGLEHISAWIESGGLSRVYPPLPPPPPPTVKGVLLPIGGTLLALLALGGLLVRFRILPLNSRDAREGLSGSVLEREERDAPVQIDGSFRYVLTRDQVLSAYAQARTYFTEYRDEAAKIPLNRILESNASEAIKNKARLLLSYTETPGFDTLSKLDRFSYAEVIQDPSLYRDCHVIWSGMAANLEALQEGTAFNFLVGYDTRSTLEGMVPVVFNFSVPVNPERPLEILARVIPVSVPGGMGIRLEGIAVHQSGLLEAIQ
jgi:tetratricopeptide (TPR) repeat protein